MPTNSVMNSSARSESPADAPTVLSGVELTSRERVNRMFERREQDRVPRHETFWGETIKRWQHEGLRGDQQTVLEMLGSDFCRLCWCWPAPFPGEERTINADGETRIVRDAHGKTVRYWQDKSGTPEHLGFECDSREKWEQTFKPALLDAGLVVNPEDARRKWRRAQREGKWSFLAGVEPFEETRALMGDEITLIALADDPDWIRDVSRTFVTQVIRNFDAIMATGIEPDGIWIYGDMAYNHATMCSPAMYRELIWPDHKRLADWAHAHDMKMIYHTDGDIRGVLDLYVEAGFDCIQPLEAKANMDIRQLAPKYGDDLAMFGNIDVMIMGTNNRDAIEHEIRTKFEAGMAKRGYIYHSDHSVPPTVSWDTYQFIIDCVERYGRYA